MFDAAHLYVMLAGASKGADRT